MIRILIADDHAIVREGLKQIVAKTRTMQVADEATSGREVLEKTSTAEFDVVVLDISMPDKNGLDVLKQLKRRKVSPPVLILSVHPEEHYAVRALRAGAAGYLTKESAPAELISALERVSQGRRYVSQSLAERLAFDLHQDGERAPHEALSDREFQVLCRIASGMSPKKIAEELCLSVKTVSTYRSRVLDKMGMKSNAELTRYAVQHDLIQ